MSTPDLAGLVDRVAVKIGRALRHAPPGESCSCHGLALECCQGRGSDTQEMESDQPSGRCLPASLASVIDHTLLAPAASAADIERLCDEAATYEFATVCVNPTWVSLAARQLSRASSRVCSVVGFPLGAVTPDAKHYESRRAIYDGATEIDMVMNVGALKSDDLELLLRDMMAVVEAGREHGAVVKVILETALLSDEEKVAACLVAKRAGAGFVKTSTGFGPGGATIADVRLMRRVVGDGMGVKAAGGVRDYGTARALLSAGASRIGTSAGVAIVEAERASLRGAGPT